MSALQLAPGTLFAGDFRIVSTLSQGGMGAVYVAEQLSTGKRRALKLMLPELVRDPKLRARFEQEARVGSRIDSEHVVEVVGAGVDAASGTPYLAMELLEGQDLGAWRDANPRATPEEVRAIFSELCHALGAAHRAGIVHRDLKPQNIFVARAKRAGSRFTVKVLDFGIAKLVEQARATRTDAMGTPLWMAPEQTESGTSVMPQTDVWALGLLAFWLLTGRCYWRNANLEETSLSALLREVVLEPMIPAAQRAQEYGVTHAIPAGFDAWFARATDRRPQARFAHADEAFAALEPVLSPRSAATQQWGQPTPPPQPTPVQLPHAPPPQVPYGHGTPPRAAYAQPPPTPYAGTPPQMAAQLPTRARGGGGTGTAWAIGCGVIVLFLGSCGAIFGLAYSSVQDDMAACDDPDTEHDKRVDACRKSCGYSDEDTPQRCEYLGDLMAPANSEEARTAWTKACDLGRTSACAKRDALKK
jgi:tRNA A-37 threonylcarbamoyl transferase component Bud32